MRVGGGVRSRRVWPRSPVGLETRDAGPPCGVGLSQGNILPFGLGSGWGSIPPLDFSLGGIDFLGWVRWDARAGGMSAWVGGGGGDVALHALVNQQIFRFYVQCEASFVRCSRCG